MTSEQHHHDNDPRDEEERAEPRTRRDALAELVDLAIDHPDRDIPSGQVDVTGDTPGRITREFWTLAAIEADRFGLHVQEFVKLRALVKAGETLRVQWDRYDRAAAAGDDEHVRVSVLPDVAQATTFLTIAASELIETRALLADLATIETEKTA